MTRNTKLILWAPDLKSRALAKDMEQILREDFRLGGRVQLANSLSDREASQSGKIEKGPLRPLVTDFFPDGDPRVEGGHPEFAEFDRHYVAVVRYMEAPFTGKSINDYFLHTASMFYALNDYSTPLRKALVAPYMPYIRAHSVDKYTEKGFDEADRLRLAADILHLCKIDDLFTIHPHSDKIEDYLRNRGITPHCKDTFRNDVYIDWRKLGFRSKEEAEPITKRLQPMVNEVKSLKKEAEESGKNFYMVVPDDGVEHMVVRLAIDAGIGFEWILNMLKDRFDAGDVRIVGRKDFCTITMNAAPEYMAGATAVVCDDMTSSGGTLEENAKYLKESLGFGKVYGLITHAPVHEEEKFERLVYIDEMIYDDTIPVQLPKSRVIKCSADILSASLYRSYSRELAKIKESLIS